MTKRFFVFPLAMLLLLVANISFSQQKNGIKPLKGLDASKIPVITSLKEYVEQHRGSSSLIKSATPVGKADRQEFAPINSRTDIISSEPYSGAPMSVWQVARAINGTVNWMWSLHTKKTTTSTQSIKPNDAMPILKSLKKTLLLDDPSVELRLMSDVHDELGEEHIRYGQYYQNIPLWNRDLYVHFDKSGEANIINGTYEPTPKNISVAASISSEAAQVLAIHDLVAKKQYAPVQGDINKNQSPSAKLVLYPVEGKQPRLAYEVSVNANLLESYFYIVDAQTGELIDRIEHFCSLVPHKTLDNIPAVKFEIAGSEPTAMPQAGFNNASGIDLNGVTRQFRTYQHTDGKYYLLWDLASYNAGASQLPDQPSGGALTLNLASHDYAQGSSIFHNNSTNNTWNDPTAVSAHYNTSVAYNYYSTTFQRKAIDDKNGAINSIIHVTANGQGMDNAFWNGGGKVMIYGDGLNDFKALPGGLDVAGHEMTHGVTENTANLVYQAQAGALNESMSDVFGVMIDPSNLLLGEQVVKNGKSCLRDMLFPNNPTGLAHQPKHMNEYNNLNNDQDNGGVHVNSGIPNRAAAILIVGLGRDKTQKIYYRALTNYLTRNSQFLDCRRAVVSSAKDLFGATSNESLKAGFAFDSVGIFDNGGGTGTDDKIPTQNGGKEYIAFATDAGQVGVVDVATAQAFSFNSTAAVARVSNTNQGINRSILTTPRPGNHIWFIDQTKHLAFIDMADGKVYNFPNLKLQQDGDLWNAAVSPDESVVAISSAYTNDPNLYFFDGNAISTLKLDPQSTDGGSVASIDYPDVISWSPNKTLPRVSFDAFNQDKLGATNVGYWSIYEINFQSKLIYNLIPAADATINIGNISYSNANPQLVTFNAISAGTEDVFVADFDKGSLDALGVYTKNINGGSAILDANRPTFSPNDKELVFSTASNNSLLFYDLTSKALSFRQYQFPMYMTYWFLYGGSADVKTIGDVVGSTLSLSPNIVTTTAQIGFSLGKTGEVTLEVLNISGITIKSILKNKYEAGSHQVNFERAELPSGAYFLRLYSNGEQKLCKFIVL